MNHYLPVFSFRTQNQAQWIKDYDDARKRFVAGELEAVFPHGTTACGSTVARIVGQCRESRLDGSLPAISDQERLTSGWGRGVPGNRRFGVKAAETTRIGHESAWRASTSGSFVDEPSANSTLKAAN